MTYDCFPFFNELDILEIRLNTLDRYVDKFVLVEASKTQSLLDKPYFFEENKARYSKFLDKIIHVKVSDHPDLPGWLMENHQRNCITRGLMDCNEEDTILISDVDEIPNLNDIDMSKLKNTIVSFDMSYHTFYANLLTENKRWIGTVSLDYSALATRSPQTLRNKKDSIKNKVSEGGWHLGYMGGKEKVYKKFFSCIEPLDKSLIPEYEAFCLEFDRKIKDGGSFLFSDKEDDSISLVKCETTYPNLPEYLVENKEKFINLLY